MGALQDVRYATRLGRKALAGVVLLLGLSIGSGGEGKAFLRKYRAKLCETYGKIQPEYVVVRSSLLAATHELKKYFDCSHPYVSSLRPKAR